MADADDLVTLYRPVGAFELALIAESSYRAFPPRLPEQSIFYPVQNERYAAEIARLEHARCRVGRCWVCDALPGARRARLPLPRAGGRRRAPSGAVVPADELDAFNAAIVGAIEVIATYRPADARSAC